MKLFLIISVAAGAALAQDAETNLRPVVRTNGVTLSTNRQAIIITNSAPGTNAVGAPALQRGYEIGEESGKRTLGDAPPVPPAPGVGNAPPVGNAPQQGSGTGPGAAPPLGTPPPIRQAQ